MLQVESKYPWQFACFAKMVKEEGVVVGTKINWELILGRTISNGWQDRAGCWKR